jgi:integrase
MISIFRRHTKACSAGRPQHDKKFVKCTCPIHAEGSLVRGKVYIRESLNTRDYREAMRRIQEAEARGYWDSPSGAGGPKKLAEAITAFLEDAGNPNGRNLRPPSLAKYRSLLGKFLAYCGDVRLDTIDPDQVRKFKDTWKMGARSAAGNLSKIRAFFRFACDNQWCAKNPAMSVRIPKGAKGEDHQKQPFTKREVDALLNAATDLYGESSDIKAAMLVMRCVGLRISDAAMLRSDSLQGDTLSVKTIKSGSRVVVPIPQELIDRLNALETVDSYYFARGSLRMETQTDAMRKKFNECAKRARVAKATPHRLRHTAAVSWLLAGLSTDTVSKLLGHSSPMITAKFYSAFTKEREKAVADEVRQLWEPPKAA